MSKKYKNREFSKEYRKKLRQAAIKRIEERYGIARPNFNLKACEFFKQLDKAMETQGQYAINGGEFYIKELGYFPDYINFDLKLIIEIDEKYHKKPIQKAKDIQRQKEIQDFYPDFKFLRFKEEEMEKILKVGK